MSIITYEIIASDLWEICCSASLKDKSHQLQVFTSFDINIRIALSALNEFSPSISPLHSTPCTSMCVGWHGSSRDWHSIVLDCALIISTLKAPSPVHTPCLMGNPGIGIVRRHLNYAGTLIQEVLVLLFIKLSALASVMGARADAAFEGSCAVPFPVSSAMDTV